MKKKIGNIIFVVTCVILFVCILGQFGIMPFRITYFLSGSMSPTYAPGDLAIIYAGKNINVKAGDVVYFHLEGAPVIHRVKNIENGQITTQGDANKVADQEKITRVDGKVLMAIPKIGYLFDYFHFFVQTIGKMITPG